MTIEDYSELTEDQRTKVNRIVELLQELDMIDDVDSSSDYIDITIAPTWMEVTKR
jgi:hypothetical protein